MRLVPLAIALFALLVGCSAQYQEGGYEGGNSNAYTGRANSQYDSNEPYARPANYGPRNSGSASYPKSNRGEVSAKAKNEEEAAAEEEEKKPSALELMLANSKFSCSGKKDGYYADSSVNCQVFHYCVGGAKHSWMCPEGTVFHQVHLNCVPAAQDICSQSEKYHIVNDYLHKPIEQAYGSNQTVRYHQRYYPEEFLGDPLASSNGGVQQYPPPAAAARPSSSYSGARPSAYSNAGYEDENSAAYRAAPSYTPAQPPRSAPKQSYSSYPTSSYANQPKPAAPEHSYKPVSRKPVINYGGGGFSGASLPAARQRTPSFDSNDDGSYKPTGYQARQPSYKPSPPPYQPHSAAAAAAPTYKSTASSQANTGGYRSKPYSGYQGAAAARPSSGYESGANKPYDYSGVTYEEDY